MLQRINLAQLHDLEGNLIRDLDFLDWEHLESFNLIYEKKGLIEPILAIELEGKLRVIDGVKRTWALLKKNIEYENVFVLQQSLSKPEIEELRRKLNSIHGTLDVKKLEALLEEYELPFAASLPEVAEIVDFVNVLDNFNIQFDTGDLPNISLDTEREKSETEELSIILKLEIGDRTFRWSSRFNREKFLQWFAQKFGELNHSSIKAFSAWLMGGGSQNESGS